MIFSLLPLLVTVGGSEIAIQSELEGTGNSVILFIGDGMGPNHIELGRLVEYGPDGTSAILEFPHENYIGTDNVDLYTTDSAAAATAIATGVKTQNGRLSTNWDGRNLTTILEIAEMNNYSTGLVAKCQLAHATPAAFACHQEDRDAYVEIAKDMADSGVDLLLGGGYTDEYFGTVIASMESNGYSHISNKTELYAQTTLPVLGLFAEGDNLKASEYTDAMTGPTLMEMTLKAIQLLNSSGKPFFLMVEASFIDSGGHANDANMVAHEVIELEKAVKAVKAIAETQPNWQLLVTADHETGGLKIKGNELSSPLPADSDSLADQIAKRTQRVSEVDTSFGRTGHSSTKVILAGMGPYTDRIANAQHHVDTFSLMRLAIEGKEGSVGEGWYDGYIPRLYLFIAAGIAGGIVLIGILVVIIKKRKAKKAKK